MSWLSKKFGIPTTPVETFLGKEIIVNDETMSYETFLLSHMPARLQRVEKLMNAIIADPVQHGPNEEALFYGAKPLDMDEVTRDRDKAVHLQEKLKDMGIVIKALKKVRSFDEFTDVNPDLSLPAGHIAQSGGAPDKLSKLAVEQQLNTLRELIVWSTEHEDRKMMTFLDDVDTGSGLVARSYANAKAFSRDIAVMQKNYDAMIESLTYAPASYVEEKNEAFKTLTNRKYTDDKLRQKVKKAINEQWDKGGSYGDQPRRNDDGRDDNGIDRSGHEWEL